MPEKNGKDILLSLRVDRNFQWVDRVGRP